MKSLTKVASRCTTSSAMAAAAGGGGGPVGAPAGGGGGATAAVPSTGAAAAGSGVALGPGRCTQAARGSGRGCRLRHWAATPQERALGEAAGPGAPLQWHASSLHVCWEAAAGRGGAPRRRRSAKLASDPRGPRTWLGASGHSCWHESTPQPGSKARARLGLQAASKQAGWRLGGQPGVACVLQEGGGWHAVVNRDWQSRRSSL